MDHAQGDGTVDGGSADRAHAGGRCGGSLGNFDAVNDTGHEAHGFEIELEGIHASDVTDTFGGAGRGFPTTVERYGSPTVENYTTAGGGFGARVTYRSAPTGGGWVGTPTGVYTTPGESCWTGGGIGYGPATPCDHFGVGLRLNPTATHYSWLVEATPGSTTLINAVSSVLAPTWTVTPVAPSPGVPAPPPVVMAQIVAPPADFGGPEPLFGKAIWVKVFTTELNKPIALEDLVGGNANVKNAENNTEVEWQLLQKDPGDPLSGILDNGGGVGAGAEAVLRRYEYYDFTGTYDAQTHEALFGAGFGDTTPGPADVGNFIGAQNAAVNFGGAAGPAGVPEPAAWSLMTGGLGAVAVASRRRRRTSVAA